MKQRNRWALGMAMATGGAMFAGLAVYVYRQPVQAARQFAALALRGHGVTSRLVMVDGRITHYYAAGPADGNEPPLVLLHGLGDSAATWWRVLPKLARALPRRRILAPDLPGFGSSELRPAGVTIDDSVTFLVHFLDALGIPCAVLIGNSLGGWIATRCTARHPERVARLIMVNSAGIFRGQHAKLEPRNRAEACELAARVVGRPLRLPGFVCDAIIRESQTPAFQSFLAHYDPARDDLNGDLGHIQVPTTIIWGTADRLLPAEAPDWFVESIPHARVIRLPGVGHAPQLEAPALLADVIVHSL